MVDNHKSHIEYSYIFKVIYHDGSATKADAAQPTFGTHGEVPHIAPYDNQVGEIETTERGLDYSEYERSKTVLACEELHL